jgi:S-adenosylmethionine:tRNA ribosyltransferase-isomerase
MSAVPFAVPRPLEAHEPPEARGLARDEVRMLVARRDRIEHARALDLPRFLAAGDLVVANTSATLPAALSATRPDGSSVDLHLSTPLPGGPPGRWLVELRHRGARYAGGRAGESLAVPGDGRVHLLARDLRRERLWIADLDLPQPIVPYLERHGRPIRYRHTPRDWPLAAYQNAFALEPGSAEMPSAGRPLTPRLLARLAAHGILVAPIVLHTGVSSLERGERPYAERYRVPEATARLVTATRAWGGRVIAAGTTVVRALETATAPDGVTRAGQGWTEVVVTPERGVRSVSGLLTGWHEPESSHLLMLEAIAGEPLVSRSYAAAQAGGYLWHEFGDVHLLLP